VDANNVAIPAFGPLAARPLVHRLRLGVGDIACRRRMLPTVW
jgi:hypothetical protein